MRHTVQHAIQEPKGYAVGSRVWKTKEVLLNKVIPTQFQFRLKVKNVDNSLLPFLHYPNFLKW